MFGPVLFQGRYPSDWTEHLLAGWLASLADPTEPASSLNYIQKYFLPLILSLSCGARVTRCPVQLPSPRPISRVSSVPWADGGIPACGTRLTLRIRCATVLRCVSGPKQPKSLNHAQFPETLQDILRFLRHDQSHERPVAFLLHSWDFLQTHLLPLVLTYHGSESLILDSGEEASIRSALV